MLRDSIKLLRLLLCFLGSRSQYTRINIMALHYMMETQQRNSLCFIIIILDKHQNNAQYSDNYSAYCRTVKYTSSYTVNIARAGYAGIHYVVGAYTHNVIYGVCNIDWN
uniref:Pectinesterase n=1 Tax=Cacopsylla melanoneura TaxID=428564 RepID=A0A8D9E8A8_9HEMI